mmetsp:Transcript_39850/g.81619  ORF Transcript_39850/g.81619 Transcript_39850/m.81619 type:complete len:128 (+) Transcript_39850:66-449(+)
MAKAVAAPKCPACSKSVYAAEEVKALDHSWHPLCFCCKACGKSLRGGNYKDHDGSPYCEADYHKSLGCLRKEGGTCSSRCKGSCKFGTVPVLCPQVSGLQQERLCSGGNQGFGPVLACALLLLQGLW